MRVCGDRGEPGTEMNRGCRQCPRSRYTEGSLTYLGTFPALGLTEEFSFGCRATEQQRGPPHTCWFPVLPEVLVRR